ncbi:hypothetical protein HU200_004224 [Digitaria exilis]|uniref:WAT1-related protein n=1 Tax=Digitaria exilis TaxID=1010633 RepID=A0A835FSS4_9POAL|nr:hypothetical protein HU200_004224 [Digitaria exilis]
MLGLGGRRQDEEGLLVEDVAIVGGLLLVQCVLAGYVVFVDHLLGLGAQPLAVIVVAAVSSAAFFLPFAVALERKRWPSKVSGTLLAQFVLIALGGTTAFQELMLLGMKKTTPAVASAMPNLSPGLIFIVAACIGLERFELACKYTQAKLAGTLVCLSSSSSSPAPSPREKEAAAASGDYYYDWILGCSYLVVAAVVFSLVTVLQAVTLARFPAPLTMCSITSAMGAAFTAILQVILQGSLDMGSPKIDAKLIAGIVILGGVVVGWCLVFQSWCLGKKGPMLVSVFGPVQTLCSAILSASILQGHHMLSLGRYSSVRNLVLCHVQMWVSLFCHPVIGFRQNTIIKPCHAATLPFRDFAIYFGIFPTWCDKNTLEASGSYPISFLFFSL